jgi:hypothetical protein
MKPDSAIRDTQHLPNFLLQRQGNFREEMGNGLRVRVTQNEDHKPKTRKKIRL